MEGGPPIFRQGFTCPALLEDLERVVPVRGCHPLRPAVPGRSGSTFEATGLVRVRSPLLTESRLVSFPPATEMFQFAGFASQGYGFTLRYLPKEVGFPIRRSPDQRLLAAPRGLSQRATSFIASRCQGIHQMPFSRLSTQRNRRAQGSLPEPTTLPLACRTPTRPRTAPAGGGPGGGRCAETSSR